MALASPSRPPFADVAFPGQDAVEQNEPHHASDVSEEHDQPKSDHNENRDQAGKHHWMVAEQLGPVLAQKVFRSSLAMGGGRYIEIAVAPATRSQLSRQQSNQCQPRPLAETEWLKKLLPGMLKRRIDGIDSGNWQVGTSAPRN